MKKLLFTAVVTAMMTSSLGVAVFAEDAVTGATPAAQTEVKKQRREKKQLTDEEKAALKAKFDAMTDEEKAAFLEKKADKKAKAELTDEEKAALKEKKAQKKELTDEEKAALKEKRAQKKELTDEQKAALKEKKSQKPAKKPAKAETTQTSDNA